MTYDLSLSPCNHDESIIVKFISFLLLLVLLLVLVLVLPRNVRFPKTPRRRHGRRRNSSAKLALPSRRKSTFLLPFLIR